METARARVDHCLHLDSATTVRTRVYRERTEDSLDELASFGFDADLDGELEVA